MDTLLTCLIYDWPFYRRKERLNNYVQLDKTVVFKPSLPQGYLGVLQFQVQYLSSLIGSTFCDLWGQEERHNDTIIAVTLPFTKPTMWDPTGIGIMSSWDPFCISDLTAKVSGNSMKIATPNEPVNTSSFLVSNMLLSQGHETLKLLKANL